MNITKYFDILKYLAELKMHEKKSKKDLLDIQNKKLKKLIEHSYRHVLLYRQLFKEKGIRPDDIKTIKDLGKLPIIDKRFIQSNYVKILANDIELSKCKTVNTTGSTGIPLKTLSDDKAMNYSSALVYYSFFEAGLRLRDKTVELTGIPEYEKHILRKDLVSTQDPMDKIIRELKIYNPNVLYSFPSVFRIIAPHIKNEINPRMIVTHGETLSNSNRKIIGTAFGAEVFDTYGSTEFNRLAFECKEHIGLHMITDCAIIEIVNKDGDVVGPGEEGEIVVTGLYNYAMPLIRYRLGDIGTITDFKCTCHRNWPLIKSIEGRTDDYIILPSGRIISPRAINIIENIPEIVQYRTIQEKRDQFLVEVVPGDDFSSDTEKEIEKQIKMGCLGEDISIKIELVKDIPRERTGKLRTVISKVS